MTPENQRDEDLKNDYPNDAETQEWMNASLGVPEKLGDRPIEEFIRNAGITVERDGEVFIEIVLNTVYELERRFSALRQSWEREKVIDAEYRKLMQEALDAIKKEKAGLEERLSSIQKRFDERYYTPNEHDQYLIKKPLLEELTRLKARNEELEARLAHNANSVPGSKESYMAQVESQQNEISRLKAKVAELESKPEINVSFDPSATKLMVDDMAKEIAGLKAENAELRGGSHG